MTYRRGSVHNFFALRKHGARVYSQELIDKQQKTERRLTYLFMDGP